MCEVQNMLDGLCQMFRDAKERRHLGMIGILEKVRCCECGHQKRLENVRKCQALLCEKTETSTITVRGMLIACFVLIVLLCVYLIYVARRYNHVRAYGSNACGSFLFYSFNDCEVIC
ncbi:uncharacterized protein LOC110181305 [Drosophila serrata]|uniref:uncharacterized protein LOC110181305 n=1 Tax=Drosophila serrata TaxID=7274 RepID=UPI000A1D2014|nr:uncharacterized protein LOC110181305 [Drosophila serrata]